LNLRMCEELARQRVTEVERVATGRGYRSRPATAPTRTGRGGALPPGTLAASTASVRDARPSLRARAGWRLVDLGLRLAVQPDSGRAATARAAGS
jgi:hypothetical protein